MSSPTALQFLSDSETEAIHQATLRILWEVVITYHEGHKVLTKDTKG
jgi:trimethylamine:corrinoid methyltransferase-like protein